MFSPGVKFINKSYSNEQNDQVYYEVKKLIGRGAFGTVYQVSTKKFLTPIFDDYQSQE